MTSIERFIASISKTFFWTIIIGSLLLSITNIVIWLARYMPGPIAELQYFDFPDRARYIIAVSVAYLGGFYYLLFQIGSAKVHGGNHADVRQILHLYLFLTLIFAPFIWVCIRNLFFEERLILNEYSGKIGAIWFVALAVMIADVDEGLTKQLERKIPLLREIVGCVRFHWDIFVGPWEEEAHRGHRNYAEPDIRGKRAEVFHDPGLLAVFQSTALCRFQEPRVAASSGQMGYWLEKVALRSTIYILDIFGRDGVATRELLERICERRPGWHPAFIIDLYETAEMTTEYTSHLQGNPNINVSVRCIGKLSPMEFALPYKYDMLVAMHALYSIIDDSIKGTSSAEISYNLIRKHWMDLLSNDGLMVLSLASMNGDSAEVKRNAMTQALGHFVQDSTIEELARYWGRTKPVYVDSYFHFCGGIEHGDWLRYFARIPKEVAQDSSYQYVLESIGGKLRSFDDLAELSKLEIGSIPGLEITSNSTFLSHKTGVVVEFGI